MLGSGTESVMAAIRVARNFTGKQKIIKMGGGYHGWSDQMVFGMRIPGTGAFEAHGIPAGCIDNTQEIFPNDVDGMRRQMEENEKKWRDSGGDRRTFGAGGAPPGRSCPISMAKSEDSATNSVPC